MFRVDPNFVVRSKKFAFNKKALVNVLVVKSISLGSTLEASKCFMGEQLTSDNIWLFSSISFHTIIFFKKIFIPFFFVQKKTVPEIRTRPISINIETVLSPRWLNKCNVAKFKLGQTGRYYCPQYSYSILSELYCQSFQLLALLFCPKCFPHSLIQTWKVDTSKYYKFYLCR